MARSFYPNALRPDQVTALYYLKRQMRRPITRLVQEAVDLYLAAHSEQLKERKEGAETAKRSKA